MGQLQAFQHSLHWVPERREKEQEIENLFEKNNERKLSNLVKEIDMQVQEVQRVPNRWIQRGPLQDIS